MISNVAILPVMKQKAQRVSVERVQTGVRMEKRILKVMKALAEYLDMTPGDLLEGVLLHVFEGKQPFGKDTLVSIRRFKEIYGLDLHASDSHKLREGLKKDSRSERR